MKTTSSTYPLRLPRSLKAAVERLSKEEGTGIHRLVGTAAAEKVSALRTAEYFAERRSRADFEAFERILNRSGGQPPREGDELPA